MQPGYARQLSKLALMMVLAIISCCAFMQAEVREAAPQFTLKTLEGKTYSKASLAGNMVLLQFWATYCPFCRADQSAVDEIQRRYSGAGLVVLAVDAGETAEKVSKYLKTHPRAVPIALDPHKQMIRRFGKARFPYYVLIDKDGRIATTRYGAGSADALLSFLAHSGEMTGGGTAQTAPGAAAAKRVKLQQAMH